LSHEEVCIEERRKEIEICSTTTVHWQITAPFVPAHNKLFAEIEVPNEADGTTDFKKRRVIKSKGPFSFLFSSTQ